MKLSVVPVILSGGMGTRLWPISREALPKPFIRLPDGQNLLQKTLLRAAGLPDVSRILTVTNRDHYFLTVDSYAGVSLSPAPQFDYLLEPQSRNTAPAITAAALYVSEIQSDDTVLLILPADHLIRDHNAFSDAVGKAIPLAEEGYLVTFGVPPLRAETGFGYVERGEPIPGTAGFAVASFVEKPDPDTALRYMQGRRHYWNSGMFCFTAGAFFAALQQTAPELLSHIRAALPRNGEKQPITLNPTFFGTAPDISVDYAVMEQAARVAVVPVTFDWSDVGSWDVLAGLFPHDEAGNCANGTAVLVDARNCYIQSDSRTVAAVGTSDLLIVDTPDALLVADRARAQDVKKVVQHLKVVADETVQHHRTVHRPWGTYTVLEEGPRFKVKRIVVKPSASLSLQLHHHRSEHWVVISGAAKVVSSHQELLVRPNESTYIPIGTVHRLSNPGDVDCVIIEVQVGDYVGEDDIVRLEDQYGRV